MVVMPHWPSADSVAFGAGGEVEVDGTLPAKRAAMFTSTPATEAEHDADHLVGGRAGA
jgi:hypothetical protein